MGYGYRFLIRTRCKTKRSPPGDPHRRLSIAVNWSVNGVVRLRPSNQVICIFLCAPAECSSCTHRPVNRTLLLRLHFSPHAEISRTARELKSSVWIGGGRFSPQNWLPRQRPLRDRKTNFRSFVYSRSSTMPGNWVTIGQVDFHIKV